MTIAASANLAAIVNDAVPDASKVNGELAHIELRALDAGATAGDTMQGPLNYGVDSGAANAYVVNPSPSLSSLVTGNEITFKVVNANTGASTLNVSSLGVKNILKYGSDALVSGDLIAGAIAVVRYDGTAWQLVSHHRVISPTRLGAGTLPAGVIVPLDRIGLVSTFFMGGVLAGNVSSVQSVTHGLGSDAIQFLVNAKTDGTGSSATLFGVACCRPDNKTALFLGPCVTALPGSIINPGTPSAGTYRMVAWNNDSVTRNISVTVVALREA